MSAFHESGSSGAYMSVNRSSGSAPSGSFKYNSKQSWGRSSQPKICTQDSNDRSQSIV